MDEFVKIRIEELKVLRENLLQKHREELAKIDVRIDELNSMISSTGIESLDTPNVDTSSMVANVLKDMPKPKKAEVSDDDISSNIANLGKPAQASDSMDELNIDLDVPLVPTKKEQTEEVDLESMLDAL